ncbi:hypothetical protein GCM10010521_62330 [Streptomyces rameus]|uniref:Glycosyltransferase RgtA/B/C/D-like domain-containing protein n=1 Tax=Streptomyces rameus TaxID=68261 RepID=A0ABN3V2U5_9ACTN
MGVPALVMLALGLWRLDRGGMWRDEAVSFQVGRRTVPQIWLLLHEVDAVHGLYYLLLHPVLAVHPDEVVLRLPSVCAAAGTAALVAALGTRLARPRVGLWAGLLYAVTPMAGHYAQEGRSYALVAAGATAATLLFVRAVRGGSWWPYGAVLGLTCWLHEFAVLLLLAHAVSLALARTGARAWRGWGCTAAATALALLPMALVSREQAAQVAWLRKPTAETAGGLLRGFLGPTDEVYGVCLGLALVGLLGLVGRRGELTCTAVGLPVMVVPPAVLMLVSQVSPLYVDRYVLYALSGAPLVVAAGAERMAGLAGRLRPAARPKEHAAPEQAGPGDGDRLEGPSVLRGQGGPGAHGRLEGPSVLREGGSDGGRSAGRLVPGEGGSGDGGRSEGPSALRGESGPGAHGRLPGRLASKEAGPGDHGRPKGRFALPGGGRCDGGLLHRRPGPRGGGGRSAGRPLSGLPAVALAGVLAVGLSLLHQFPLLQQDRDPGRRPDDLGAISRAAAREVGPGDPVLFVPASMRNVALTYPGALRGTRDVALVAGAAETGTLYGREAGVAELRRRLARLDRVWVVGDRRLLAGRWAPRPPVERAKVAVLWQEFAGREEAVRGGVTVRLYVRPVSARPRPPSAPPRPERR